jgi:hypothetical protein
MQYSAVRLLAVAVMSAVIPSLGRAQGLPPHAWLFGSWSGGLFPPMANMTAQACLAQPVVIFTRDVVLRATLTDLTYVQRGIETARTSPTITEFRFVAMSQGEQGLFGEAAVPSGFGCENENVLHVLRQNDNEISFPGCADFPYPLIRCPSK